MPVKNFNLQDFANPKHIPTLPFHYDFIVSLYNDQYSKNTIYNYYRDLIVFAVFLDDINIKFKDLKIEHITFYKGWLKQRKHIIAIKNILKNIKKVKENVQSNQKNNQDNKIRDKKGKKVQEFDNNGSVENVKNVVNNSHIAYKILGGFVKNNNPDKLSAITINRMLVSLRKYLRFLIEIGNNPPILPDQVKLVKTDKNILHVPELNKVLALIEAPSNLEKDNFVKLRNRAMLETLLATGLRISELLSLNREQIGNSDELYVKGKGRKERIVYLTPRALKHLQAYLKLRNDPYPALFVPLWVYKRFNRTKNLNVNVKTQDPRISANYLQSKIAEYRRILKLGVPISAHTIRHAFATYLIENGANVEAVRILLGHESLNTTTKYVNAAQKFAKEQHKKLHPVRY